MKNSKIVKNRENIKISRMKRNKLHRILTIYKISVGTIVLYLTKDIEAFCMMTTEELVKPTFENQVADEVVKAYQNHGLTRNASNVSDNASDNLSDNLSDSETETNETDARKTNTNLHK
jgi:hypothetical protein